MMMLIISVWVAVAFWSARTAARKGYSFRGYLILSLLFWPAALVVAFSLQDGTTVAPHRLTPTPT